jgi:hypothetical protein
MYSWRFSSTLLWTLILTFSLREKELFQSKRTIWGWCLLSLRERAGVRVNREGAKARLVSK